MIQATTEKDHVNVRMVIHLRAPGMQHTDESGLCSEKLRIESKLFNSLRGTMKQQIIKCLLIAVKDWIQLFRNSKNDMKVRSIQNVFLPGIDPFFFGYLLTVRTAAISAGVIVNAYRTAVFADARVDTKASGLAVSNCIDDLYLILRWCEFLAIVIIEAVEHILNSKITHYSAPPSSIVSRGLLTPISDLLLMCR